MVRSRSAVPLPQLSAAVAAAVGKVLAARDLRLTTHRTAVLAAIEAAHRPLTADEVASGYHSCVSQRGSYDPTLRTKINLHEKG